MLIDLKLIRVTVELDTRPLRRFWIYRKHFKRYVKRYIPALALTCDWCGGEIQAGKLRNDRGWVAGCLHCSETIGHIWPAGGRTEAEALARWQQTGGKEFQGWPFGEARWG